MSAKIITLPPVDWNKHQREPYVDTAPCECDVNATLIDLSFLLGGRPPRSKPVLIVDNSRRIITGDDFFGGSPHAA